MLRKFAWMTPRRGNDRPTVRPKALIMINPEPPDAGSAGLIDPKSGMSKALTPSS